MPAAVPGPEARKHRAHSQGEPAALQSSAAHMPREVISASSTNLLPAELPSKSNLAMRILPFSWESGMFATLLFLRCEGAALGLLLKWPLCTCVHGNPIGQCLKPG